MSTLPLMGAGITGAGVFSPSDLASLALWLKDAGLYKDAAKTQPANVLNDAIYTRVDWSGNGRDAVQATAANRPLYKPNALNGLAGVNHDYAVPQFMAVAGKALGSHTVSVLLEQSGCPSNSEIVTAMGIYPFFLDSPNAIGFGIGANIWQPYSAPTIQIIKADAFVTPCVLTYDYSAITGLVHLWVNGALVGTDTTATGISTSATWYIGSWNNSIRFFWGNLIEGVVCEAVLSDGNRLALEGYLAARGGIP